MKPYVLLLAIAAAPTMLCAQDWSRLGNAGNSPASNFLGTTDSVALVFRVNNAKAGRIEPARNVFLGHHAGENCYLIQNPGSQNTGMGSYALRDNFTGFGNTAIGFNAMLAMYEGTYNTAIGMDALLSSVAGIHATAVGSMAMYYANNTTTAFTNRNVAVGYGALRGSTTASANTGNGNTAVGYQSLLPNTTGSNNMASGEAALGMNTTGSNNTGAGYKSLRTNTTGSSNTGCGYYALSSNTTGTNNTGVGRSSNVSSGGLSNATALGYSTSVNASNKVRLGNSSVTVVEGQVPYTNPSDARFKRQVQEDVKGLDFILQLRPVSYAFDRLAFARHIGEDMEGRDAELSAQSAQRTVGFLAQEVEKTIGSSGFADFAAVHVPENAQDNYGLAYSQFVVPLVKAVQELHQENLALRDEIARLADEVKHGHPHNRGVVEQRLHVYPQPASDLLHVQVPAARQGQAATIEFVDADGRLVHMVKAEVLSERLTLQLPASLSNGSYVVVLRVEGHEPESARVVIAR